MALDEKYDFRAIERKWQAKWPEADLYHVEKDSAKPKFYGLEFFPYPSGAGLSVGHFKNYAPDGRLSALKVHAGLQRPAPDGLGRLRPARRERGHQAPAQPRRDGRASTPPTYKRQLNLIGMSYDWDREINSSDPRYYHWTQWIFLLLHKRGLAYRQNAPVNWCPKIRPSSPTKKSSTGAASAATRWSRRSRCRSGILKITAYAERLLADLDTVDWPEGIKLQQRNWIGRSEGARSISRCRRASTITVFTTRPDTLWGATFMVLAPEHPAGAADHDAGAARRDRGLHAPERSARPRSTGRRRGARRPASSPAPTPTNPVNGQPIPIWIADYVLMGYGTGAIMAVPAHDQRDFEFARKFGLPIVPVYQEPGRRSRRRHDRGDDRQGRAGQLGAVRRAGLQQGHGRQGRGLARGAGHWASPSSPTASATGCSPASATGACRSRSSTARRTAKSPSPTTNCR